MDDRPRLIMTRFCGKEYYPVTEATWHLFKGDRDENEPDQLWLEIAMDRGEHLHEDTACLEAEPHWELNYSACKLDKDMFKKGFQAEIPESYDVETGDYATNFYYCEHESSQKNCIEVLDREQDRLLLRLSAEIQDVNYYDGSKPDSTLFLEAWVRPE